MDSLPIPDFGRLIARLSRELRNEGIPFMLIGGQAVLLHGEPRLTLDIDVTLGVTPERLDDILNVSEALDLDPPAGRDQDIRSRDLCASVCRLELGDSSRLHILHHAV